MCVLRRCVAGVCFEEVCVLRRCVAGVCFEEVCCRCVF